MLLLAFALIQTSRLLLEMLIQLLQLVAEFFYLFLIACILCF